MLSVSSCFLLFLHFRKSLKEIFLELNQKLRWFIIQWGGDRVHRETQETTQGPGRPPGMAWREDVPPGSLCPMCLPSAPLFSYKIPLDLNTEGWPLFSKKLSPTLPLSRNPNLVVMTSFPAPCWRGESSWRPLYHHGCLRGLSSLCLDVYYLTGE